MTRSAPLPPPRRDRRTSQLFQRARSRTGPNDADDSTGAEVHERMVKISTSVDAARDHELAIGRLRSRIEHVLDLSRDAFIETDARGVLTEWNRQSEVIFGWSRDEVLGRLITEFLIPERYRTAAGRELESMGERGAGDGSDKAAPGAPVAPRGIRGRGPRVGLHRRFRA